MNTVDYAARADELADHLAAHFSRRTLALFIARDALMPALREAYGNPAMRDVNGFIAGAVAEFQADLLAAERAAKREAKMAAAEAAFAAPAAQPHTIAERAAQPMRPRLTLAPAKESQA